MRNFPWRRSLTQKTLNKHEFFLTVTSSLKLLLNPRKLVARTGADYDDVLITENRNYYFFKRISRSKNGEKLYYARRSLILKISLTPDFNWHSMKMQ